MPTDCQQIVVDASDQGARQRSYRVVTTGKARSETVAINLAALVRRLLIMPSILIGERRVTRNMTVAEELSTWGFASLGIAVVCGSRRPCLCGGARRPVVAGPGRPPSQSLWAALFAAF